MSKHGGKHVDFAIFDFSHRNNLRHIWFFFVCYLGTNRKFVVKKILNDPLKILVLQLC